jgi:hypothetical protein
MTRCERRQGIERAKGDVGLRISERKKLMRSPVVDTAPTSGCCGTGLAGAISQLRVDAVL